MSVRRRVLVVHNFYKSHSPSGENGAVLRDIDMLNAAGYDVRTLARSSDSAGSASIADAGLGLWARKPVAELQDIVSRGWIPNVMHVHNLFPLITTSVVRFALRTCIPIVHTVHNYRRTCAAGTHFREGRICEDCVRAIMPWPSVAHGCYRGSSLQTVPVAINQMVDRGVWARLGAYIALTPFMRDRLVQDLAIPQDSIVVRPTSVSDPGDAWSDGEGLIFVGRLSREKGVALLLDAWACSESSRRTSLTIVGDGPERDYVLRRSRAMATVAVVGREDVDSVAKRLKSCKALVLPSIWYEGFPTVVAEAFSYGKPVIACDNPNARSFIGEAGWLSAPDARSLSAIIDRVLLSQELVKKAGRKARSRYEAEMTLDSGFARLEDAYNLAIERTPR